MLLDQLKQQANLKITLSEKGPHERVLCIPGDVETVFKAFSLVSRKLWEFVVSLSDPSNPRMLVLRNSLDCHVLLYLVINYMVCHIRVVTGPVWL